VSPKRGGKNNTGTRGRNESVRGVFADVKKMDARRHERKGGLQIAGKRKRRDNQKS